MSWRETTRSRFPVSKYSNVQNVRVDALSHQRCSLRYRCLALGADTESLAGISILWHTTSIDIVPYWEYREKSPVALTISAGE